MPEIVFLYTTAPDAETAERIAGALLEARLIACANILPGMRSVYRWKGAVETAEETAAIFKTTRDKAEAARAKIAALHPYETACIVAAPVVGPGSNPAFLDWVAAEVSPAR